MSEDAPSSVVGRRRALKRGPLLVTNPDDDSDENFDYSTMRSTYNPPPLPSPSTHSPHSEQSSLPSTSYTPRNNMNLPSVIPDQSPSYAARSNPSNPSLSSPSGSSSPAVESTPPPSTPGHSVPPSNVINDNGSTLGADDKLEVRQKPLGARMSVMDRVKQHLPLLHSKASSSRSATSPTVLVGSSSTSYTSPTFQSPREPFSQKVLLTVTADCDNYTFLDITGVQNAAIIREKIFSKLQISDDQQPFFSVYRTEIGSFAIGDALTDDRLMEICREEGDAKGTVKFLVQHSSAAVHLPTPPPRTFVANHVPPVLPYQESFPSPSSKARSTKSGQDDRSSVSESFAFDPPNAFEGSASDDMDPFSRERQRHTIRPPLPPPQNTPTYSQSLGPVSPLEQRRVNNLGCARDPSPQSASRRPSSPLRTQIPEAFGSQASLTIMDRGRGTLGRSSQMQYSPNGPFFDDNNITPPSTRRSHNHSASDAAAEREKMLEQSERMQLQDRGLRPVRRDEKPKQDPAKRRGKASDWPDSSKGTSEPWVVVPRDSNYPSSIPRVTPTGTSSQSGSLSDTRYNPYYPNYSSSSSRTNLPPIPVAPSRAPPPPPTSNYRLAQAVPKNWPIKYVGDGSDQRSHSSKGNLSHRLNNAKSMDNLRPASHQMNQNGVGLSPRKPAYPSFSRPSAMNLRELSLSSSQSNQSFMNMDGPTRKDTSGLSATVLPRSYDSSRGPGYSPTTYTRVQGSGLQQQQESSHNLPNQVRPLPTQNQSSSSNGSGQFQFLSAGSWRSPEDLHPRPHSALEHIGASPAPQRPVRPLPSTGGNVGGTVSFVDVDYALDEDRNMLASSSHHPFAAPGVRPLQNPGSSRQNSVTNASAFNDESSATYTGTLDSNGNQNFRSPHAATPDSPQRAAQDKLNGLTPSQSTDSNKSFVSLSQDSPVYDGDHEGASSTLKAEDHAWLIPVLGNSSASEGTLRPGSKNTRVQMDKPLPSVSSSSSTLTKVDPSHTFRSPIDDRDSDSDGDDDDDAGSLWNKRPLKSIDKRNEAKRPILEVNTGTGKPTVSPLTTTRSPFLHNLQGIPPNMPPPNFPPPPPPPIFRPSRDPRRAAGKGSRSDVDGSKRDSQFIKSSTKTWAFRPPAEEVVERMEEFFPDFDLDKPVIEATSGGSSPTAAEANAPPMQPNQTGQQRSRHKKSLRHVAAEHKKKVDGTIRSDSSSISSIMRKRSTKLWGSKVEEVTPSGVPPPVPESPTAANPKPIFVWVRGELIGKGTYGKVYLALNATTGEMIAVKQVEIPKTDSDRDDKRQVSVVEALKLESETLKDLDHPNIVQYLGFEQTPDFLSIFLEYVPGGSVAGCLRKHGKFEDQVARSFTAQILAGLEYLHANGIIHRDLKADNILVDPSGICKISDFGISKRTDDININGEHTSMQGSVFWMAPEVVQAASKKGEQHGYNGKVDIWSLGCVVLEMWAGRRPWQNTDAITVIYELITKQEAPPVPDDVNLSPEADDFRQKCFATNPDDRPGATELRRHPYLHLQPGWTFTGFK